MNVRCPYCTKSFNLSRDYMVDAVAEAAEKKQRVHAVECSNCRKVVKVPVKQMRRFVPKSTPTDEKEVDA